MQAVEKTDRRRLTDTHRKRPSNLFRDVRGVVPAVDTRIFDRVQRFINDSSDLVEMILRYPKPSDSTNYERG